MRAVQLQIEGIFSWLFHPAWPIPGLVIDICTLSHYLPLIEFPEGHLAPLGSPAAATGSRNRLCPSTPPISCRICCPGHMCYGTWYHCWHRWCPCIHTKPAASSITHTDLPLSQCFPIPSVCLPCSLSHAGQLGSTVFQPRRAKQALVGSQSPEQQPCPGTSVQL